MTKDNKLYIPKDEIYENFFWIAGTKEGLSISLNDFGYEGLHITIFVKEKENENVKLNFHITKEGNPNKPIFSFFFDYNPKNFEEKLHEKFESLKPQMEEWLNLIKEKAVSKPKNTFCSACFIENNFNFGGRIHKREEAKELWREIKEMEDNDLLQEHITDSNCNKENHRVYFEPETNKNYIKLRDRFVPMEEMDLLNKKFLLILGNVFKDEISLLESIVNKIKEGIKDFKEDTNSEGKK